MGVMPRNSQEDSRSKAATILFGLLLIALIAEWPVEIDPGLYHGLWRSPFSALGPLFLPLPGVNLTTWQVALIFMVPFCLAARGAFSQRSRELDRAIFVSLACIAVTFLWGWMRGGSPYFAYYQVWRFLAALLFAYILMCVVRGPNDFKALAKLIVFAALIRATLCIYFYWTMVQGTELEQLQYLTNHDDALLCVTAILITGSWALLKGGRTTWLTALLICLYLFYAMVLNDRRIAWVELAMAMIALYFLLQTGPLRRRINKWAMIGVPLLLVYIVAGQGSDSAVFAPVQALLSAGSDYDPSSLARQEELRNLLKTLVSAGNPLLGTGWGLPYEKTESLYSNYTVWIFYLYTPHNSLLGLAVFSGLVGIIGIWGVVPVAAWLAARSYRRSSDPTLRIIAMVVTGSLVTYSVHCYGDLGFQSFTCGLIFGTALAAAGKIAAWSEEERAKLASETSEDAARQIRRTGGPAYSPRFPR